MNTHRSLSLSVLYCLGWFPVAIFALYLKHYHIAERYTQLIFVNSNVGSHPDISDYLFIYRGDILLNFLVIPLGIILVAYLFSNRSRILLITITAISLLLLVLLYANQHSWGTVGRFLTWSSTVDAATFAWQNPSFIEMYIDYDSRIKFAILVMVVMVSYLGVTYVSRSKLMVKALNVFVAAIFLIAITMASIGHASHIKETRASRSFISLSISSLFESYWEYERNEQEYGPEKLVELFGTITNTRSHDGLSQYFGRAEGSDVIVFVLETGAGRFMDLHNDLDSFPTLKKLSQNSLIALNHHATFPATSESLFSLFNSIYPPRTYYSSCIIDNSIESEKSYPGFVSSLNENGYMTSMYIPYNDVVPLDHALHQNIGFEKIYFAQTEKNEGMGMDVQALEAMKRDISGWLGSDQRYVAVYLPQIGHAPWPDRPESVTVREYGKRMAVIQDKWLGEVVELIEQAGRLDKTIIVVTGDHGIRTTREDPGFNAGFIDEYSFRVPLLIFSKSAFNQPVSTNTLTSHIDISPTLLDLYGINREKSVEQGLSVWDQGMNKRVTYFLANWYFGADGYHENGKYKMYSELLDAAFSNTRMHFDTTNLIEDNLETVTIRNKTRQLYALQQEWLKHHFCN